MRTSLICKAVTASACAGWGLCATRQSDQVKVLGTDAGEHAREGRGRQAELALPKAAQHRAVIVEHRIVAVLEQGPGAQRDLLAGHRATARQTPAQQPVNAAVAVVGAAVAVLAEGAVEFARPR